MGEVLLFGDGEGPCDLGRADQRRIAENKLNPIRYPLLFHRHLRKVFLFNLLNAIQIGLHLIIEFLMQINLDLLKIGAALQMALPLCPLLQLGSYFFLLLRTIFSQTNLFAALALHLRYFLKQ